jgi:hypothetical protein
MKPFPDVHSVLVMHNCRIHHTDMLQDLKIVVLQTSNGFVS